MAESSKRKTVFEVFEKRRKTSEERNKTRVFLGKSFSQWRVLKTQLAFPTDASVAKFLLDSYNKLTETFPQTTEFATSSSCTSAGSESSRCPSCGFVLPQRCPQNRSVPKEVPQPQSIEVTLELEPKEEVVSGAEEADQSGEESIVSEEEEDNKQNGRAISDDEWIPPQHQTLTRNDKPTEASAAEEETSEEEEGSEGSGVDEEHCAQTLKRASKPGETGEEQESKNILGTRKLCTECGIFYKKLPHECEHKTKPFVCNTCGKRCVSESALKIHNGIHLESYEHACKYCYINFKTRADKLAHELIHQEQKKPFECRDCKLTFATYKERLKHITQHRDETPFKCVICGIVFRQRSRFLRHVVVHTGEKAFKCPMCERGFNQKGHLDSHMRLHTGERPYMCQHCDRSFNHNVSLKSHMQRYHNMEPEACDVWCETPETGAGGDKDDEDLTIKAKRRQPSSGRPKGRPKRSTKKMEMMEVPKMTDSDEESY